MENDLDEFRILQNSAYMANVIYYFIHKYEETHKEKESPKIFLIVIAMAMLIDKSIVNQISNKNFKVGSFIKILTEHDVLLLNLQAKAMYHTKGVFKALSIGFSSNLFLLDCESLRITKFTNTNIVPLNQMSRSYQDVIKAANRLGAWFAQLSEDEICNYLNVKF